jgi:hypothetical protein
MSGIDFDIAMARSLGNTLELAPSVEALGVHGGHDPMQFFIKISILSD